jgi:hypothetical protein
VVWWAQGFTSETSVAVAWAHFIAMDLFAGRQVNGADVAGP